MSFHEDKGYKGPGNTLTQVGSDTNTTVTGAEYNGPGGKFDGETSKTNTFKTEKVTAPYTNLTNK